MKVEMSEAQYDAMTAVLNRRGNTVIRYTDATVSTMLAMKRRNWVDLVWITTDGKRRILSAKVRPQGLAAYDRETVRREAEEKRRARLAAVLATTGKPSLTAQVDAFSLVKTRELAIPF